MKPGTGRVFLFDHGARIIYSNEDSALIRHIVIAHELGHVILHTAALPTITKRMEIEATYYAEEVTKRLVRENYHGNFFFSDEAIRDAVLITCPNYNPDILDEDE